eukprot:jgi/Psemu1/228093/e_gw1.2248.2.1
MVVGVDAPPLSGWSSDSLKGRFVVVTGANNGIGKETVRMLAAKGATVAMLCRSPVRAEGAVADILAVAAEQEPESGRTTATATATTTILPEQLPVVAIDLADLASIRKAAAALKEHLRIRSERSGKKEFVHALVCNAGLMMGTQSTTKDGFETMMQANHLGHFLLMTLLLEEGMLRTTTTTTTDGDDNDEHNEPSRVCLLTSSTYEFAASTGGFDFEDPYCSKGIRPYTLFGQYSMTKLANLLTARELARRTDTNHRTTALAVFAVHPGIVRTNVTSNMNWYWRLGNTAFGWIVAALSKTPPEGAYSTVHTVAAPLSELAHWREGPYVVNCRTRPTRDGCDCDCDCVHPYVTGSTGERDAARLWDWSVEQLQLPPQLPPQNARRGIDGEKKDQ